MTALALPVCISSCDSQPTEVQDNSQVLVTVGDSSLTVNSVLLRIPSGLSSEDSINLFTGIVEEWVKRMVLADYARNNISDIDRIEKMVDDYRNNLIVNEYLQTMSESSNKEVSEERIKAFYDASSESMILEQPIVKGVLLKVSENDPKLSDLRRLLNKFNDKSIDEIENSGLHHAIQYKYFNDEWVEWNTIADQIPYRFYDADAFLRSTSTFETNDEGMVYLMHISDYVPSGEKMPYEFARIKIADIIQSSDIAAYKNNLIKDIYKRQIRNGVLKPGIYDPVNGKIMSDKNN